MSAASASRRSVILDAGRVEEIEDAALAVCGLVRLAANVEPGALDYVFDADSPVWELLRGAESSLFNAVHGLRSAAGERRAL